MKRIVLLALPLMMFAVAQSKPASKPSPAVKPAASSGPVTVPADATQIAPNVWRATDNAGKTWIYRQTPFGLSKVEDNSAAIAAAASAQAAAPSVDDVKATDLGTTVRFEKPTPMGNRVWTRNKTELSTEEKGWLEKSKATPEPSKQASK